MTAPESNTPAAGGPPAAERAEPEPAAAEPAATADPNAHLFTDPREEISYGVLMANGHLAPRLFASRQEAEEWALPDEQVVSWNYICACDR